jgi:nucleotide-binding universal stress UspA family protein
MRLPAFALSRSWGRIAVEVADFRALAGRGPTFADCSANSRKRCVAEGMPVSNFKKILVAIDFSESSKMALDRASSLATQLEAELDVLNVWEAPAFVPPESVMIEAALGGQTLVDLVEKRSGHDLDAFVAGVRERGVAVGRALSERGAPSQVIVQMADRERYDLLVLGTHGRTGVSRAVMGSVAERVVRHAHCPVLTVRGDLRSRPGAIRRILVAVDYSAHSLSALECAASVADALGATLEIVHVRERPAYAAEELVVSTPPEHKPLGQLLNERAQAEMDLFLRKVREGADSAQRVPQSQRVIPGDPARTLLEELDKGAHDLVVLGTRGRTGLEHLLLGSVAEKLVRFSRVPVLTVPRPGRP